MPQYRYVARTEENGPQAPGTIEAPSRAAALAQLRHQGLWVSELRDAESDSDRGGRGPQSSAAQPGWAKGPWHAFWPIPTFAYGSFFLQLGQLIGAGVNMHEAVLSLRTRIGTRRLQRVLTEIAPAISAGGNLGDQLEHYPQLFPPHICGMVRAGETSGKLPEVCTEMAEAFRLETIVWAGMTIPKLLYSFVILIALFSVTMPEMLNHGENLQQCLSWYLSNTVPRLVRIILIALLAYQFLRTVLNLRSVKSLKDTILYYLPGINVFLRNAASARFLGALRILIGAGIEFAQALDIAATATGSSVMARQIKRAAERLRTGSSAHDALANCVALPADMRGQLATAEQSGRYDDTLDGLSAIANQRRKTWMYGLKTITYVLGAVLIVAIIGYGVCYGWKHFYEIIIDKFGAEEG
jgi:type II secretory pathway component PulF